MNQRRPAFFITFEGGEGSGKTTLIRSIESGLHQMGRKTLSTREPGGSTLGIQIRQLLLHQGEDVRIFPMTELMLFLADRAQHLEEIILPALNEGKVVLCDRFNDSTIAYQGVARGLGIEAVQEICLLACHGIQPDLTLYLDLDPRVGMHRAQKEQRVFDRLENEKILFHDKVREGFQQLAQRNPKRILVIDAKQSPEQVMSQAWEAILSRMNHS